MKRYLRMKAEKSCRKNGEEYRRILPVVIYVEIGALVYQKSLWYWHPFRVHKQFY